MGWSWRRRGRAAPVLPLPGPCANRRHAIRTERLVLYTPETSLDIAARLAAAADPEAQRWVGAAENAATVHFVDARIRDAVLNLRPGDPDSLNAAPWTQQMR